MITIEEFVHFINKGGETMQPIDGIAYAFANSAATGTANVSLKSWFRGLTQFTCESPSHVLHHFFASQLFQSRA
jgi:hypothetical protein